MAEKYDGWVAKDKDDDFWFGTFGMEKEDVEYHLKKVSYKDTYKFKIVKVKLVEVE